MVARLSIGARGMSGGCQAEDILPDIGYTVSIPGQQVRHANQQHETNAK